MPRRAKVNKREIAPDAKFGSFTVSRLVNKIMVKGKKSVATGIVYGALDSIKAGGSEEPIGVLEQAIKNITPLLEVRPRRVGGATYQVPVEVRTDRGLALAMRWLIQASRSRTGKSMSIKLASEIVDASQGRGTAVKKREDTHKMAEANRAFVHYKW